MTPEIPQKKDVRNMPGKRIPLKSGWKLFVLTLTAIGITVSTACLWFQTPLLGGQKTVQESSDGEVYQLSGEQVDLLSRRGYPQAFTMLFYEEEAPDGSLKVIRQETWDYYMVGESYTFLNGELARKDKLDGSEAGSLAALPYIPEQFSAGMSMEDMLTSAGLETFIEVPLDKQYLEGGNLYYGESLAFGMIDGQLRYLEALALIEE